MAAEKLVLFAIGAIGAFKTADKKHRYSQRDQDGEHTRIRRKPMKNVCHKCHSGLRSDPKTAAAKFDTCFSEKARNQSLRQPKSNTYSDGLSVIFRCKWANIERRYTWHGKRWWKSRNGTVA